MAFRVLPALGGLGRGRLRYRGGGLLPAAAAVLVPRGLPRRPVPPPLVDGVAHAPQLERLVEAVAGFSTVFPRRPSRGALLELGIVTGTWKNIPATSFHS